MPPSLRAALLLGLLTASAPVAAADLPAELEAARASVTSGDTDTALEQLEAAEDNATESQEPVPARVLSQLWHLRGAAFFLEGGDKHLDAWRMALVLDNELPWDENVVTDSVAWDLFEALRREVRGRPEVDLQIPAALGAARLYVDGVRKRPGDGGVQEGQHLGQVECPDGTFHGKWTDFRKKMKWLKLCPDGVDTTVVVAEEEATDDEWGDFGPAFGPEPGAEQSGDESDAAVATVAPEPLPQATQEIEIIRKKVHWPAFVAGAGALAAAGTFQAIALSQSANYNDLDNPDYQTAADLEALRKATNRNQTVVYPLLAVSGGLFFAATYQW